MVCTMLRQGLRLRGVARNSAYHQCRWCECSACSWLAEGQPAASISPSRSNSTSSGRSRNRPACCVWTLPVAGQSESASTCTFGAASRSGAGSGLGEPLASRTGHLSARFANKIPTPIEQLTGGSPWRGAPIAVAAQRVVSRTMRLTHIAAGADGSDEGKDAVALAAGLASLTGAGLSLVNVFPTVLFPSPGTTDRATLRKQADESLRRDRDELAPDAIPHSVADLSVSRALMHFAQETHVEMMVIGSSRDAPPGRARIGRRGRQLLHDMPFALALAPRGSRTSAFELGRVGLGDDGGPEAKVARDVAIGLCRAASATLVIKSVIDSSYPILAGIAPASLPDHEAGGEYQRSHVQNELERQAAEIDVPTEVSSVLGDPGHVLRSVSDDVDLIVVGSRRWGPIARLVTGGVGETLVADAGCPIVIAPRPSEEK